jgi:hypothetical protein
MQKHPSKITKDYVLKLNAPTDRFLCPLQANESYKIQFLTFRIRSIDEDKKKNQVLFLIERQAEKDDDLLFDDSQFEEDELSEIRTIRYNFPPAFLDMKTVGTYLEFKVGDKLPVKDFMIIERHYFRDRLLESYEFTFPFCMPGSTNSWEKIYTLPDLPADLKKEMLSNPWETTSDTFYFVGDTLIMHNKAKYSYAANNQAHDLN